MLPIAEGIIKRNIKATTPDLKHTRRYSFNLSTDVIDFKDIGYSCDPIIINGGASRYVGVCSITIWRQKHVQSYFMQSYAISRVNKVIHYNLYKHFAFSSLTFSNLAFDVFFTQINRLVQGLHITLVAVTSHS